jgi:hypothetical protein
MEHTTITVVQFKAKETFVCSQAWGTNIEPYLLQTKLSQDS